MSNFSPYYTNDRPQYTQQQLQQLPSQVIQNGNNFSVSQNTFPPPMQPPTVQQVSLIGKLVENKDILNITEIPVGSFGIFPRNDLKEIYIKTWNEKGTTDVISQVPVMPTEAKSDDSTTGIYIDQILQKIDSLERKIDALGNGTNKKQSVLTQEKEDTDVMAKF